MLLTALIACDQPSTSHIQGIDTTKFFARFAQHRTIELQENNEVVNVAPIVNPGRENQFVVADPRESQIRIYDSHGRLLTHFGRSQRRTAVLQRPTSAHLLTSGQVAVSDVATSRLSLYDVRGTLVSSVIVPLFPLVDAVELSPSHLLLTGMRDLTEDEERCWLHIWNIQTHRIEQSFFPTPGNDTARRMSSALGNVTIAIRRDTLVAAFALVDTLYLFRLDGTVRARVPIPFDYYPVLPTFRRDFFGNGREALLSRIVRVHRLFWLDNGNFLIEYTWERAQATNWGLIYMSPKGEKIWELPRIPRLVLTRHDTLYFVDPRFETPNHWLVMTQLGDNP